MRFNSTADAKSFFSSRLLKVKMAEAGEPEKPDIWVVEDR